MAASGNRRAKLAALVLAALALATSAHAGTSKFKDPDDGAFDMSGWLSTRTGFFPVLTPITEPAVGYGAALTLAFFHGGTLEGATGAPPGPSGRTVPTTMSGIGGMATENGSWGAYLGQLGYYQHDRWRLAGLIAKTSLNLDYFTPNDRAFAFNMESWVVYQELTRRVGKTDLFAGARFVYLDNDILFEADNLPPDISAPPAFDVTDVGLGVVAEFDTRDNTLSPSRGFNLKAAGMFMGSWLGGDNDYQNYSVAAKSYFAVHPRLVLSARVQGAAIADEPPFYARPYVLMRGIPRLRYQGDQVASLDGEVRWDVYQRWWLVGFGGVGWTHTDFELLEKEDDQVVGAGGLGFRYLIARRLGLLTGLDVARGPEEFALYVVVGSSI